jgi:hypothetical protein
VSPPPKYKLDLYGAVLPALDNHDLKFFEGLDEEQRKGFSPPVVQRTMATVHNGSLSEYHIWIVNERANRNFHDLWKHPELQYLLLASCGSGRRQRHAWVNMTRTTHKSDKISTFLQQFWPAANDFELGIIQSKFTDETFYEFVRSSGSTPEEEKEVLDAYDKLTGKKKSSKKATGKKA